MQQPTLSTVSPKAGQSGQYGGVGVGQGSTVTRLLQVLVHPLASVTVTQYVVVTLGDTTSVGPLPIEAPPSLNDHVYVTPPLAVSVID